MSNFTAFCPCCQSYHTDDKHQNHCLLGHAERRIAELEQRLAAAESRIDALLRMQAAVQVVADESDGIAGWHMNGEIAKWEEILPEIFEDHTQIKREVIDD